VKLWSGGKIMTKVRNLKYTLEDFENTFSNIWINATKIE
jgi:hypothetical protein